jgi:hypothetical protein
MAVAKPGAVEPVGYEADIKPLFRPRDHGAMKWAFDLWSYEDVSNHSDAILAKLRTGAMPCDGAWPANRIDLFDRWIRGGKLP